ncbi:FAD binding domain-containing protein [Gautieria morchelliformis]|nr:FAD binding domain-containing protein [Gautieria morchelliformis]
MSPKESFVDVLVIGAGPAGLMCAQGLAKFGVNIRIVDQRAKKVAAGQADGIQPRTIEVLQSYGLADRLLSEGNQMHLAAFYNPGPNGGIQRTGRAPDVTATTARFPFEASAIEAIFLDAMSSYGVEVERPIVPISMQISSDAKELADPHSHPVKVVLKRLDGGEGTEVVRAKYVVGADGAHSWVRKALDIDMEGEQTDHIWGVVDTIPETNFPDIRNKTVIHSNNGSCMVIPREGDKVRLYLQLTEADVVTNGRVDKTKMDSLKLMAVAKKSMQPYTIDFPREIEWWTIYIIGQRVASSFQRKERVFIAGDACHTHSPKAGQGMNASMNDTHNLTWKITQVLRGWSSPALLSTYEYERRKYAQDLIAFDRKFAALFSGQPRSEKCLDGVTHEEFIGAFQTFGGFTSGIGIHYRPSVITNAQYQSYAKSLIVGERIVPQMVVRVADGRPYQVQDLLPADARFKLLIFTGDAGDERQLVTLHKLAINLEQILVKYARKGDFKELFEILTIRIGPDSSSMVEKQDASLPKSLQLHWSKVFIDQPEVLHSTFGESAYITYGIQPSGAVVVVRPDGFVGTVAPLDKAKHLDEYFSTFMNH